jgi:hypothetical protein
MGFVSQNKDGVMSLSTAGLDCLLYACGVVLCLVLLVFGVALRAQARGITSGRCVRRAVSALEEKGLSQRANRSNARPELQDCGNCLGRGEIRVVNPAPAERYSQGRLSR